MGHRGFHRPPSPTVAEQLAPQDYLYLLSVPASPPDRDVNHVIESLSAVHPAGYDDAWLDYFPAHLT